jgi:hypothetical protein
MLNKLLIALIKLINSKNTVIVMIGRNKKG